MISFPDALAAINVLAKPFDKEFCPLEDADGRILADNCFADRNYPPFNRAAMDGYAIMYNDWENGLREYKITEVIYAGQASEQTIHSGYCYKIMTGATTPPLATVIIRREDSIEQDNVVTLKGESLKPYQNIAREGEDAKAGALILEAPLRCEPQIISLLTSIGKTQVSVYKLPKVAVITTGNEVVKPDEPIAAFQIRNSNQYLLRALLKKWNINEPVCIHVQDNKDALRETLQQAILSDITIINGGVSAGDADYVPQILHELGVKEIFHQVAMRPGKPIWTGKSPSGGMVFALPGNPLSCLTTFTLFIESYLYKSFGFKERIPYKLPLLENRSKKNKLTEFFPVRIATEQFGLHLVKHNGSGDITAGLHANGLAVHAAEKESIVSGEPIDFYPFNNYL
ncbi:Molybdopterin biosynthesis protein MoeA [Arcticibacter svalbardensis MN12-7]|uniref:Molybdopterin molybdenumtransferase n=1 Tax=Arcticibacter svalbardensis MN12-7 TaxID=1150600 RepID=R9GW24_9SPHI|nr:molybdopterin molybdotransferase MoeA [Arcticibacter svalbardensis]EOR95956.1 Molybdopterin biosynthesis protein MoeA [Arcticibacter svalbardensis MN12-7]